MQQLTVFYTVVIIYLIIRIAVFIYKWSSGDFKAKGYSGWLVRESLVFGLGVFVWLMLIYKQQ